MLDISQAHQTLPKEQFEKLYLQDKLTLIGIANLTGLSIHDVLRLRREYKVPLRRSTELLAEKLSKDTFDRLYNSEHKGTFEIASLYQTSEYSAKRLGRIYGIIKTAHMRVGVKGRIAINENFFKTWTPQTAYVVGWLFTDGTIQQKTDSNSFIVRLAVKDYDLLENIRSMLSSSNRISKYKEQNLYFISIFNRTIAMDLLALGMTPRKSTTVSFPAIPPLHLRHFIRGCFEGDGSVFYEKRGTGHSPLRTKFCSASRGFLETLEAGLRKDAGLSPRRIYESKQGKFFEIKYSHAESLKLFRYMYDGTSQKERLKRKFNLFLPFLAS